MFKKLIALLLAAVMASGLAACAGKPAETQTGAVSVTEGAETEEDTGSGQNQTPDGGMYLKPEDRIKFFRI